jgi:putative methyltransferase
MSLYHETVGILTAPDTHCGSLKSRIFGNKDLKSPPA